MSQEHRDKIYELMGEARRLGDTPEALALAEEAVRLADSHNDAALGYAARMRLMDIATFSGDPDKLVVAFSWCLAYADQQAGTTDEGGFSDWELLWKYKWVISKLTHFSRISRAQIFAALDDFQARCRKAGYNERSTYLLGICVELKMGNLPAAQAWAAKWKLTKRDGMADCEACELNSVVELLAAADEHEAAIVKAGPILKGRKRCGEIPHLTYAVLLRSFWQVRGRDEATQIHEKGYRLVRGNREFLREQAMHIEHLLRAEQSDIALTLVRRHLKWALAANNQQDVFYFLLATRAVMRRLADAGLKSARLQISEKIFPPAGKTTVPINPFSDWLTDKINGLAAEFDRRNGNQWFSQQASRA